MSQKRYTRRQLFSTAAQSSLVILGAGIALSACKGKSAAGPKGKSAAKTNKCDADALSDAEKKGRSAMKYVDQTPIPAKRCDNCKLFKPGQPCGGCTVVKGPIAAAGYCVAWVKKPA